ncbi:hypothetical protein APS_0729 [Acetobacter pasteurianus subsp. pasteurianus LMG 1262 = NBRC 106471]|nr:hypothetical protein APS_0729 [Acetobacter pasteurianus subsp. pasteurianus LMG 1262 = NBRC 106471]
MKFDKISFFFKKVPDFSGGLIAPLSSYRNNPYQKQPIFNYVLILILKLLFIYKYLFHNFTIFEKKPNTPPHQRFCMIYI